MYLLTSRLLHRNLVLGRKRKLKDLCQVARQIQWNKALSGQYVFKSGRTEIDDFEQRFLEFNDLFLLVTHFFLFNI